MNTPVPDPLSMQSAAAAPAELSDAELAEVSGGLDVTISGVFYQQSQDISAQSVALDNGANASSLSYTNRTSIFAFQFQGSFRSARDLFGFLAGLSNFLERRGFL